MSERDAGEQWHAAAEEVIHEAIASDEVDAAVVAALSADGDDDECPEERVYEEHGEGGHPLWTHGHGYAIALFYDLYHDDNNEHRDYYRPPHIPADDLLVGVEVVADTEVYEAHQGNVAVPQREPRTVTYERHRRSDDARER